MSDCKNYKESKVKSLLVQLWKLGLGFIILTPLYFINIIIFYSLIDVDVHIKLICIDFSHIKLLRASPKYQLLACL